MREQRFAVRTLKLHESDAIKVCPCCGRTAREGTYDSMTWIIECSGRHCRVKVERGIINRRTLRHCRDMCRRAWNKRPKVFELDGIGGPA